MSTTFGSASALGLPAFSGADNVILGYPAATPAQGYLVQPGGVAAAITSYTLVYDLFVPSAALTELDDYGGLFQTDLTNSSDGDLFVRWESDGVAGIGIGGQYAGPFTLDSWHRVAFTFSDNGDGTSALKKYIDGELVGEQSVSTSRFTIDGTNGFLILTDEDGTETSSGFLSSFAFVDKALAGGEIGALGGPDANGILKHQPAGTHAVEFGFDGDSLAPTLGSGTLTPKEVIPNLGTAGEQGVAPLPNDAGVLVFPASAPEGGYLVDPGVSGAVASYTMVFDLLIPADASGDYGALFQTNLDNANDSDFFIKKVSDTSFGVGISGQYEGTAELGQWHRIAVTLADNGNGTSTMTKFIDGVQVGSQQVDTARFTVSDSGVLILTDEDGETFPGYLNSFLFTDEAMSAQAIADLGAPAADGILALPPATGHATQFDFDGQTLAPSFGAGTMIDRANPGGGEEAPVKVANAIKDMMVTPDAANVTIDLTGVFEGSDLTYTVTSSDGSVLTIVPSAEGTIELDFAALGYSDVKVTATDADGNAATDWFRVRVAGPNAYTIAVLPDTQDYTNSAARIPLFQQMTQWLADNADEKNIQFALNVGDMTSANTPQHWQIAADAYALLDGIIPYAVVPGNHDQSNGGKASDFTSLMSQYFPPEKFSVENGGTLGGVYAGDMTNNYHTFTAPDGTKWLVLSVEFGARDGVFEWAEGVVESHLDHRVIMTTHMYTNYEGRSDPLSDPLFNEGTGHNYGINKSPENTNDGEEMWRDFVSKYSNINFVFSGHVFGDGAETFVSYNDYGNPVYQMVVNYQNGVSPEVTGNGDATRGDNGGNGAIRLITIDPDNDKVWTETYFAGLDEYLTGGRGDDGEPSRDGLTGDYREHQQEIDLDLGAPDVLAKAKAGDDQFVTAEAGENSAVVTLDAGGSVDPENEIVSYSWTDSEGRVVATGETAQVELGGGRHDLTLTTTDVNGVTNSDEIRVIVSTDKTLLVDNFNDGDIAGWKIAGDDLLENLTKFGTADSFDLPSLPGGEAEVMSYPTTSPYQGYLVKPGFSAEGGGKLNAYTMIFDLYVPAQGDIGTYGVFFQTDPANKNDGEIFIYKQPNGQNGLEIGGGSHGNFTFDAWHRVAFTVEDTGTGLLLKKFIDGVKVGEQTAGYDRLPIDPDAGFLIFTDEGYETYSGYLNSFFFSADVLSESEIAGLGGPDSDGILDGGAAGDKSVQFDFTGGTLEPSHGTGTLEYTTFEMDPYNATWKVKGTFASQNAVAVGAPEGDLYEYANASKALLWDDPAAKAWSNYVFELTILSQDDDAVGVYVYYQDADNHYKLTLDIENNKRLLVKVQDGVETVLAEAAKGYPFNDEMELRVAVVGDTIYATLDGQDLFGGPILDAMNPLTGGTVGLISINQYQSIFDDITVTQATVTAHAGVDQQVADLDGNHEVTVALDASGSFAPDGIVSYLWMEGDEVIATGKEAQVNLKTGAHAITLVATDVNGKIHQDLVEIDVFNKGQVLLADGFGDGNSNGWKIVDEGELGDAAAWSVAGGKFTQSANTYSRELGGDGNTGVWGETWSPLGDGWHVLRKGTYALHDAETAYDWTNYAVETTIRAADKGAVGILFHYQDPNNYYKLEIDSNDRFVQLTVMVDGIEQSLELIRNSFALNEDVKLEIEVRDNKIQAWLDGMALFPYAIEDRSITSGTVGLYSWGTAGVAFDDVLVRELNAAASSGEIVGTDDGDDLAGTDGDDIIRGLDGDDRLDGQAGNDVLEGGTDDDMLAGGADDDVLDGGGGDDALDGDAGDDVLEGGSDDDDLDGGEGDDVLAGDDGDDALKGAAGADALLGGDGDDGLDGGTDDDELDGGAGDDTLDGGAGDDVLKAGAGADLLIGGLGDDSLEGGDDGDLFAFTAPMGHDVITDFVAGDVIRFDRALFGDFEDLLSFATQVGPDVVITLDGQNSLTLQGVTLGGLSASSFEFVGGVAPVHLVGTSGNDVLTGGAGNDSLAGGYGNDQLTGRAGDDVLDGGYGNDSLDGGSGKDALKGGYGNDSLDGGYGDDGLDGGYGNDSLAAGAGNDSLDGGYGDDELDGGAGNDSLDGGYGNDSLAGGLGDDVLTGGRGSDAFVFAAGFGTDKITDFGKYGDDVIEFDADLFASFDAVKAHAAQVGSDVVITFDQDDALTLVGVKLNALHDDDFRFVA